MLNPETALAAGSRAPVSAPASLRRALVVGAGGVLGSAVLEQLLASHRFACVAALVQQQVQPAVKGFVALPDDDAALRAFAADTVLVVFDGVRQAFRREAAWVAPLPQKLPQWAARALSAGARRLIVVVPHRAALLPMALQQGLATLDEAAVAALGFEQLVFMRMAQPGGGRVGGREGGREGGRVGDGVEVGADDAAAGHSATATPTGWSGRLQRLADWMLSQLNWMAPQREQPVRPATVARVAAALALELPQSRPATRVLPAQLLWHAAQQRDVQGTVRAWLDSEPLPALPAQQKLRL